MASAYGASAKDANRPRARVTRNALPKSAWAAVAPSATTMRGATTRISAFEPGKASLDFDRARLAVNAPRPTGHPLEVLDDIGDIGFCPVDPSLGYAAVKQLSRRPDKGASSEVFRISRLLADEHHWGALRPLSKYGLRSVLVQATAGAARRRVAQSRNRLLDRGQITRGCRSWLGEHGFLSPGASYRVNASVETLHPIRRYLFRRETCLPLVPRPWQSAGPAPFHGDPNAD